MPERIQLCLLPTPCHPLPRLSEELDINLWIKRDDLTGFALGGNKGRKLEFLMAEALAANADAVVTCGAAQSNFVRQLGAACTMFGIECHAVVMHMPYEPGLQEPSSRRTSGGNLLADEILGVHLHWRDDGPWDDLFDQASELAISLRNAGSNVYEIPVGGSSPLAAYAFTLAGQECPGFDTVITPSSSGSTHAGLAAAFAGTQTNVIGIACDPEPEIAAEVARLAESVKTFLEVSSSSPVQVDLRMEFVGDGYGVPTDIGAAAAQRLARREGIFLDPVYGAKAFSGLLALAESGELKGRVLYWHTGGIPGLFASPTAYNQR